MTRKRKIIYALAALVFFTAALFVVGEVVLRLLLTSPDSLLIVPDPELGWRARENVAFHKIKTDAGGAEYQVDFTTDAEGFRWAGDPQAEGRKRLLIIGDSFTHAAEVSDEKTFAGLLAGRWAGRAEVFAYGALGYGTLQEWLILERHLARLRPDVVLLQVSGNDLINNHFELEVRSIKNNNNKRRPFMTLNGEIIQRVPRRHLRGLYGFAFDHSRFLYYLLSRTDRLLYARKRQTLENGIRRDGLAHPRLAESLAITARLLAKMKERCAPARLVLFTVDDDRPYDEAWRRLARDAGVDLLDDVGRTVYQAELAGVVTRGADRVHWNEAGHRICAERLAAWLETSGGFLPSDPGK